MWTVVGALVLLGALFRGILYTGAVAWQIHAEVRRTRQTDIVWTVVAVILAMAGAAAPFPYNWMLWIGAAALALLAGWERAQLL